MSAGAAITGAIAYIRQPVAGIMLGIAAQHPPLALVGERCPSHTVSLAIGLERGHRLLLRQEGDPVATPFAGAILEIEDVAAGLADKELQDLASSEGEFYQREFWRLAKTRPRADRSNIRNKMPAPTLIGWTFSRVWQGVGPFLKLFPFE